MTPLRRSHNHHHHHHHLRSFSPPWQQQHQQQHQWQQHQWWWPESSAWVAREEVFWAGASRCRMPDRDPFRCGRGRRRQQGAFRATDLSPEHPLQGRRPSFQWPSCSYNRQQQQQQWAYHRCYCCRRVCCCCSCRWTRRLLLLRDLGLRTCSPDSERGTSSPGTRSFSEATTRTRARQPLSSRAGRKGTGSTAFGTPHLHHQQQ